jgi:HJR/Mrr/RecB family endonuclease
MKGEPPMPRSKRNSFLGDAIGGLIVLFFMGISAFVGFWNSLEPSLKPIVGILLGIIFIALIALIIVWINYRKFKKKEAWRKAMSTWNKSIHDGKVVEFNSARYFSPAHLEKFSAQLFKQMGYQVVHTGQSGDHGVDVHLTNPLGEVELVQCKQWYKPVGEPEVRDLVGAMVHEKAVRGYILAPGGFSEVARRWAKGKKVILADSKEIGRMVESAYNKE